MYRFYYSEVEELIDKKTGKPAYQVCVNGRWLRYTDMTKKVFHRPFPDAKLIYKGKLMPLTRETPAKPVLSPYISMLTGLTYVEDLIAEVRAPEIRDYDIDARIKQLRNHIDRALDANDKAGFMQMTAELNGLLAER